VVVAGSAPQVVVSIEDHGHRQVVGFTGFSKSWTVLLMNRLAVTWRGVLGRLGSAHHLGASDADNLEIVWWTLAIHRPPEAHARGS
jgi:hypothetical protein